MTQQTPHDYRTTFCDEELALLKKLKSRRILEVCAGDGKNVGALRKAGYDVVGIESDAGLVRKARKTGVDIVRHPIFGEPFPFKDGEFDFVYSYQYLNHDSRQNIERVLTEIHRVLRDGGVFSVKITDIDQWNVRHVKEDIYEEQDPEFPHIRYRKTAEQTFVKLSGDEKGIPHYGFKMDELAASVKGTGFEVIDIRKIRWNLVCNARKRPFPLYSPVS